MTSECEVVALLDDQFLNVIIIGYEQSVLHINQIILISVVGIFCVSYVDAMWIIVVCCSYAINDCITIIILIIV